MKKKIFLFILILIVLILFVYGNLLLYGIRQGAGQFRVLWNAVPVDELLHDPATADTLKEKLLFIAEVKEFAANELGIRDHGNYTSLYDQKGKAILWNVSASKKYKLEAFEWSFPFLGKFSYKGYFNYDLALKEEKRLKEMDLDTRVRTVAGWSTLGWFKDPILSNMLNRPEGQLAELVIHELIHGNIYVKDSVDFNENLASFFGQKGAVLFLEKKYGPQSPELNSYLEDEVDFRLYVDHMLRGASRLDSLYSSLETTGDIQLKMDQKEEMIRTIVNSLDTLPFRKPERYQGTFSELPNNAYFMSINRYRSKTGYFERELKDSYNGDLKAFLEFLVSRHPSL